MREARFWTAEGEAVRCGLCPHHCRILPGKRGICGVRENREGILQTLVWGRLVAAHVDPVEKKPLFHFLPGTDIFSIAAVGCNLSCRHCQNADISQFPREKGEVAGRPATPEEIVRTAVQTGCRSLAFTYTEPTVFIEYALDCAALAREEGLRNVFVTNGYISPEALDAAAPHLDAVNVDLKGWSEEFYHKICGARLRPVLDAIEGYRSRGVWVEVTTLLIPGLNDDEDSLRGIARYLAGLGREIPWHVSRFHPDYRMQDRGPTPLDSLERAWNIGQEEGLLYVYQGNVPAGRGEDTHCPHCRRVVIRRRGFSLAAVDQVSGRCAFCGGAIHGIFTEAPPSR
jgi:pyruvate formate lyase activating enzyme